MVTYVYEFDDKTQIEKQQRMEDKEYKTLKNSKTGKYEPVKRLCLGGSGFMTPGKGFDGKGRF